MEELKLILATVENVSDGALVFAVWWLVKDVIIKLCVPLCIILPIGYIAKLIVMPIIRENLFSTEIINTIGTYSFLSRREQTKILKCLKENYNQTEEEEK